LKYFNLERIPKIKKTAKIILTFSHVLYNNGAKKYWGVAKW